MPLPVFLDLPPPHRARYAYAIETLLDGLGLRPAWTAENPVLAVGLDPPAAPVRWTVSAAALDVFGARRPVAADEVFWIDADAGRAPVLFGSPGAPDFAGSAFFWLSGWQEYTTVQVDAHGRFPYAASLQHALGTATLPAVDVYSEHLGAALREAGIETPGRDWGGRGWALCPTHDLDALRKWTPATVWKNPPALAALWRGDPYKRGLEKLIEAEQARGVGATYFVKGGAAAPEDHAYPLDHAALRSLYAHEAFEIGLHPSYHAFDHPEALRAERERLRVASGRDVSTLRHHYLRYTPRTPGLHAQQGWRIDATLGFAEHEGFRRGTCRPFRVYDLVADRTTDVWEMPLALMDTTLYSYRALDADAAWQATETLLDVVRRFGGACVALWHNDAFDRSPAAAHFTRTLDAALASGALVTSLATALRAWQSANDEQGA